jgi:hypothetical protein
MTEPGLASTTILTSWLFGPQFIESSSPLTRLILDTIWRVGLRGLHVGDVAGVGGVIYENFCEITGRQREEGREGGERAKISGKCGRLLKDRDPPRPTHAHTPFNPQLAAESPVSPTYRDLLYVISMWHMVLVIFLP